MSSVRLSRIWLFSAALAWGQDAEGTLISLVTVSWGRCFPVAGWCLCFKLLPAVLLSVCSLSMLTCRSDDCMPCDIAPLRPSSGTVKSWSALTETCPMIFLPVSQLPDKTLSSCESEQNAVDYIRHGAILRYLKVNKKQHRETKNNTTILWKAWMCHVRSRVREEKLSLAQLKAVWLNWC